MEVPWHQQTAAQVMQTLLSSHQGLNRAEAAARLAKDGPNALAEAKGDSLALVFLRQFASPLIYLLFAAAAAIALLGETLDAMIIAGVIVLNAAVGAVQEGRAQNTLRALRRFVQSTATVIREGREESIPDAEVVVGDILVLREGDRIAADARIVEATGLRVDESLLTGESVPAEKTAEPSPADAAVADRHDMVFRGAAVVGGQGLAVVVATGVRTVVGAISRQVAELDTEVPLRAEIRRLSRLIVITVVIGTAFLFTAGLIQGRPPLEMLTVVISLAVSVIPEGLPIVVTLVLATGVWRMTKRNALVKRLQAVQALGRVDIIAVDKTGTITRNELVVRRVALPDGRRLDVAGEGYESQGAVTQDGAPVVVDSMLTTLCRAAALTATAQVSIDAATHAFRVLGDPTEAALKVFAAKVGVTDDYRVTRKSEVPFDSTRRFRAVLHALSEGRFLAIAGAPESVLPLCDSVPADTYATFEAWAADGMRVLAIASAFTDTDELEPDRLPRLTFAGLVGMQDDLRAEVPDAVRSCQSAGVRVVMITGDHALAGAAIAAKAGIRRAGDTVLTGADVTAMTQEKLQEAVRTASVFSRVTPEQKLLIIQAWRAQGLVVAMTGDGVNDAPSLVAADLGVAMGRAGTEVAKEASDIVLLDDNLGSIVAAIEEGRSILKTIKKVILYLFSTSTGEVIAIAGALLLGWPLPLFAGQIIWLNLVTDGFLDIALSMDPKEPNLLRPEFKAQGNLVDRAMGIRVVVMALPMALGTLWVFSHYLENGDLARGMTMALVTLAMFQWFNVYNCRFTRKSVFAMDWRENYYLLGVTAVVILLQVAAVYVPFMQTILRTVPLSGTEWAVAGAVASSVVVAEELRKFIARRIRPATYAKV